MSRPGRGALRLVQGLEAINERVGRGLSWLTLFMVLVTFAVVILRYVFAMGWIAMQESVTYMHAVLFLGGAAFTLKHHGHVRVDIFYHRFSRRGQAWVDLLGSLLLLIPVSLFIAWVSWDYVVGSWELFEGSREAGGLPGVFLLKTMILVMAGLLILQGLALALRCALFLRGVREAMPVPQEEEEEEVLDG